MKKFTTAMLLTTFLFQKNATMHTTLSKLSKTNRHCSLTNTFPARFSHLQENSLYLNSEKLCYFLTCMLHKQKDIHLHINSKVLKNERRLTFFDIRNAESLQAVCKNYHNNDKHLSIFQILEKEYQQSAAQEYIKQMYSLACKVIKKHQIDSNSHDHFSLLLHNQLSGKIIFENGIFKTTELVNLQNKKLPNLN